MSQDTDKVVDVGVAEIRILNPRARNKQTFQELVTSIKTLGLKKPITVCQRADGSGYDLVCGQGRLEACIELGEETIPAIVINTTHEDCFIRSLVENMARRQTSSLEFMREIVSLRSQGYDVAEVASKIGCTEVYVSAVDYLHKNGEERLLTAVDKGTVPPSIAIEISHAKEGEVQRALAEAYENKMIPGNQIMAIRKIVLQRNTFGKEIHSIGTKPETQAKKITAQALVKAFERETKKQRVMVRKASLAQAKLLFLVDAFKRLLADSQFVELLLSQEIDSMPRPLADRVGMEWKP